MPARTLAVGMFVVAVMVVTLSVFGVGGCSRPAAPQSRVVHWLAGREQPAFDPDGAPDALRWALERHLSRGLTERDSTGRVRLALADSCAVSADSLTWTLRLREGLAFTDGTPLTSAHVVTALRSGLARTDHATRGWVLGAVAGVAGVRAGKPLPPLGITATDARTVVLRLAVPDHALLERLSLPGVSTPWKSRSGAWRDAIGVGPYRVATAEGERTLTLVAARASAGEEATCDTLVIRFVTGAARVRSALRANSADVVWPLPPGLLAQALPSEYTVFQRDAVPKRRLLLVLRADVPPTTRPDVRAALVRALNRDELLSALGARGTPTRHWLPGTLAAYSWVRPEPRNAVRAAARDDGRGAPGKTESYHVVLAYDADLTGADVARAVQGRWARSGHYADLRPVRGAEAALEALAADAAQAHLVESQALFAAPEAELALYVLPLRGPAVGSVRTGWRVRDLDRWVNLPESSPGFDPDAAQRQLADAQVVLPLASIPWQWAARNGGIRPAVHPAFGPGWVGPETGSAGARSR